MVSLARRAGHLEGYQSGYREGYRLGGYQALLERIAGPALPSYDLKVVYIPQGFESIDDGIISGLRAMVRELIIGTPGSITELALREQPDVVLILNGLHVFPDHLELQMQQLRERGIRTAIWFVDDPYFTEDTSRLCLHFDYVFTHELSCVELYRQRGARQVHYLPLAVHPELFRPVHAGPAYQSDICFIGNAFRNRAALFDALAPFLKGKKVRIIGGFWQRLARYKELSPFVYSGFIPPAETVKFYNGAKMVINLHRPCEYGEDNRNSLHIAGRSINPRTFEINACGTLQITDVREDLSVYYTPGVDIETFGSVQELKNKLAYYLAHEEHRRSIAMKGLETTLSRHTYAHRLPRLLDILSVQEAAARK
ncbi:CgeB family protein [Paenibacillus campinasensis]|uniref:Spore maturation protein n=1 Tax=Paenibacillus campinasensis TaxID=66347 RepID=A0A268EL83_9BACL|nr:glycosyltransferase [Paenibacillus campinasensis]PAD73879.1 spore maturation protein [Paenibacillus campinasensis]